MSTLSGSAPTRLPARLGKSAIPLLLRLQQQASFSDEVSFNVNVKLIAQVHCTQSLFEVLYGLEYTSEQFQKLMADNDVVCSMIRSGNVWDNAAMESFFSSLKTERTARPRP